LPICILCTIALGINEALEGGLWTDYQVGGRLWTTTLASFECIVCAHGGEEYI